MLSQSKNSVEPFVFTIGEKTAPDRVVPEIDESLASILTRLVQASGHHSMSVLADPLEMRAHALNSPATAITEAAAIAELCGYSVAEVERRLIHPAPEASANRGHVTYCGEPLRTRYVSVTRRAVSPASLRARPTHRMIWDVTAFGFCPESHEILIDRCPSPACGKLLRWGGNSVTKCDRCDFDLRIADAPKLRENIVELVMAPADLLSIDEGRREAARNRFPAEIAALPAGEIIYLSQIFGICIEESDTSKQKRLKMKVLAGNSDAASIDRLATGVMVLLDPDEYLNDVISEVRGQRKPVIKTDPFETELGILADLLRPDIVGEATADFFEARLRRYYDANYLAVRRTTSGIVLRRFCSKVVDGREAARILGPFRRWLADLPKYNLAVVGSGPKRAKLCVDKAFVEKLAADAVAAVRMNALASELKIPSLCLDLLVQEGRLSPAPHVVSELLNSPAVVRSSWDEFATAIEARQASAPRRSPLRGCVAVSGGGEASWNIILRGLADGEISLAGVNLKARSLGRRWLVDKIAVMSWLNSRVRQEEVKPLLTACHDIGLRPIRAFELAEQGDIEATQAEVGNYKFLVTDAALQRFRDSHYYSTDLAVRFDMSEGEVRRWLQIQAVEPLGGTSAPIIFAKADVDRAIDSGVRDLGHLSKRVKNGAVAWLQLLQLPTDTTALAMRTLAANAGSNRRVRLSVLADLLDGYSIHQSATRNKVKTYSIRVTWIPEFRKNSTTLKTIKHRTSKCKLNDEQRSQFEEYARSICNRIRNNGELISIQELHYYTESNFGITYSPASIRYLIAEAGIAWPNQNGKLQASLNDFQIDLLCAHVKKLMALRKPGDCVAKSLILDWVKTDLGVQMSLGTLSRILNRREIRLPNHRNNDLL